MIVAAITLPFLAFVVVREISNRIMGGDIDRGLALGQLCFDALILPTAAIGFYLAIREFRGSQSSPQLILQWEVDDGARTDALSLTDYGLQGHDFGRIVLHNQGSAVGIWYLVRISLPSEILLPWREIELNGETVAELPDHAWLPLAGEKGENWQDKPTRRSLELQFMSMGKVASYPGHTLAICQVEFMPHADKADPKIHEVHYEIFTDRGKPKPGRLTIKMDRAF